VARAWGRPPRGGGDEFRNGFDTDLRWQANVSRTDRSEPDMREVTYQRVEDGAGNVTYEYLVGTQSGAHFASALDELSGGGGLDWTLHLPRSGIPTALKLGGLAQYRDRRFAARRFRFLRERRADRDAFRLPPDDLFSAEHIGPDLRLEESTRVDDTYDATQLLGAAYGLFDVVLFPGLRTIAGVRFEYSDQEVVTRNPYAAPGEPAVSAGLATWDVFPSVNLVYALREGMNLRCGVSQTTARPEFRELTPFAYFDFVGGQYVFGNPDLLPTHILNADLRWEWFPAPGEVLAVSAFYKNLTDPIEAIIVPTSELARSYQNAAGARVAGAEVEARVSLGHLADALDDFQLMANFTYVWSRIQLAAEQLGVGPHLRLGRGEEQTGGRKKSSILSDAFEALMGAIFLDAGFEAADLAIRRLLGPLVATAAQGAPDRDYKTLLQELVQGLWRVAPHYQVEDERGPDHAKTFTVAVFIGERLVARADGQSKKAAEQMAARRALRSLRRSGELPTGDEEHG
jgi:outer membrane receptor protein involved in Fe transport